MARKKRYQYEEDVPESDLFVSRSQKKRDSSALQQIGEEIAALSVPRLEMLPLNDDLKKAFAEFRKLTDREAKRRLLQYVGRLMREEQDEAALNGTEDVVSVYLEIKKNF